MAVSLAEVLVGHARKAVELLLKPELWPAVLLFLPKINLIGLGDETAGIRFDDVVLLLVAVFLLSAWTTKLDFIIEPFPAMVFATVAAFCTSNLLNIGHSSFLYSLRFVEYLIFYWSGKALVRAHVSFGFYVKFLLAINCIFILLQFAGIVGGFSASGYESAQYRPFGISANHPAEMGALLNLLFAAFTFGEKTPRRFWYWCGLLTVCVFMTASRSALFVHCLLTLVYVYRNSKNRTNFVLRATAILGVLISVLALVPNLATERLTDLLTWQNVEVLRSVYDSIPVEKQYTSFAEGGTSDEAPEGVDVSLFMRGYKWIQATKVIVTAPWIVWIFGLGPGAFGPALDGGWLRLMGETGIVGTLAFIGLLRKASRLGTACAMAVLALAVNMVMIDSHIAYKVMAFLFFLVGARVQTVIMSKPQLASFPAKQ
jgi:hypothetical protein